MNAATRIVLSVLVLPLVAAADPEAPRPDSAPKVCFAPDEPCLEQLTQFFGSATKTLDIAIYHLNDERIARQIIELSKTIAVRVVADQGQIKIDQSLIPRLVKEGVGVRYGTQGGIFHHQFVVVDGERVELGSFNFTTHAFGQNQENQIYLNDPAVAGRYQAQYEKMWTMARVPFVRAAPVAHHHHPRRHRHGREAKRGVASEPKGDW